MVDCSYSCQSCRTIYCAKHGSRYGFPNSRQRNVTCPRPPKNVVIAAGIYTAEAKRHNKLQVIKSSSHDVFDRHLARPRDARGRCRIVQRECRSRRAAVQFLAGHRGRANRHFTHAGNQQVERLGHGRWAAVCILALCQSSCVQSVDTSVAQGVAGLVADSAGRHRRRG